jgi:hypothetical protein
MANKKRVLTAHQTALLMRAREAYLKYRDSERTLKLRIEAELRRELEAQELATALEIRAAWEAGVPKSHIGKDAMDTTDPGTPRAWLEKTDALQAARSATTPWFAWTPTGTVAVRIPKWETAAVGATDYPEILEGIVAPAAGPVGWVVIEDPGSTADLPGWLTWELDRLPTAPKSLAAALDAWAVRS